MIRSLKYIISFLFLIQMSCQEKKQNPKTEKMTKYEWLDATSAPLGYPVDVFSGGLTAPNGEFTSLFSGTTGGEWGAANRGMSNGEKSIPNHLHTIWVSYAEKIFYEIDTDLDYEKMLKLFNDGYFVPSMSKDNPQPRKENFNQIIVGFAPGGVVVVWLSGAGRQVEVGRYQSKKIVIPKEDIDALSPGPRKNMFDPEYQRKIIHEFGIVPKEIAEANEGKPIPYGLWDDYRKKYNWRIITELPNEEKNKDFGIHSYNGDSEELFGESLIETFPKLIIDDFKWNIYRKRAVPKKIDFSWVEGNRYYCEVEFDENEIFAAFEKINKENPNVNITIQIAINIPKTAASVKLTNGKDEIWLKKNKILVGKTKFTY